MASYNFNVVANFTDNGSNYDLFGTAPQTGTLSDQQSSGAGSTTFEPGDSIDVSTSGSTFPYLGTVDLNGVTWVVLDLPSGLTNLYAQVPDPNNVSVPSSIPTSSVNTSPFTTCFLAGTRIATPEGERPVEALVPGDLVLTMEGRAVPVRWLGRQTVMPVFGMNEARRPVEIAAGALAEGVPARALRVTAEHALLLDGVLVNAGALVNGTTIRRLTPEELGARFTVFHVETAAHEIILAEGAPAETFVDNASRRRFDNHADYAAQVGADPAPIVERPEPRALSARQVPPAILAQIAARAAALGQAEADAA